MNRYQGGGGRGGGHSGFNSNDRAGDGRSETAYIDCSDVRFVAGADNPLDPELFALIAKKHATTVGDVKGHVNKPTQLRKFYDELGMWTERVRAEPDRFREYLPFIRMLNAKVAYAKGRSLVDANYEKLVNHALAQVASAESLYLCKTFFEAFMGYYKVVRPKD